MVHLNLQNSTLFRALTDLDNELRELVKEPIELNTIGGFALILNNVRKNPDEYTDIDFVGQDFDSKIRSIIGKVGMRHNLGQNWLNNDVSAIDSSIESLELMVGEVEFKPILEMQSLKLNAARPEDILRMKVVAIDTWIMAMPENEPYTRTKDFGDIELLLKHTSKNLNTLKAETNEYVIMPETYALIEEYLEHGHNRLVPIKK